MDDLIKDLDNYKRLRVKDYLFAVKKTIVLGLYAAAVLCALIPLIRGVDQNDIPFPYLIKPLSFMAAAILLNILFFKKISFSSGVRCIQKDIFLTEKGYMGLMGVTFFALGCLSMLIFGPLMPGRAYAKEQGEEMWVNICNSKERNVLFRNDDEMMIEDKVRLEIPKDDVPEDSLSIQVVATSDTGKRYVSRKFRVRK